MRATSLAGIHAPRARVQIVSDGTIAGSRDLDDGEYRIGARADCDLVIPDAHFPHIAIVKVDNSGAGKLTLVPLVSGISLDGRALAAFAATDISDTATMTIGPTTVRLTPGGKPLKQYRAAIAEKAAPARHAAVAAITSANRFSLSGFDTKKLILAAALLCAAAVVSMLRDYQAATPASPMASLSEKAPRISNPDDILKLIRHQLAVSDLSDAITVRQDGKSIVIEGSVTDRQEDRFRVILAALRRKSDVDVRSQVKPVALPAQAQIAGVALAPVAMVVMQDGSRFQVGDTLPKGWRVESISQQGVVLSRDSLRETIPLGGK